MTARLYFAQVLVMADDGTEHAASLSLDDVETTKDLLDAVADLMSEVCRDELAPQCHTGTHSVSPRCITRVVSSACSQGFTELRDTHLVVVEDKALHVLQYSHDLQST